MNLSTNRPKEKYKMEVSVYSPYNSINRPFRKEDIDKIIHSHGLPNYIIKDPVRFQRPMVHSSYVRRKDGYTTPSGQPAILAPCPEGVMDLQEENYEGDEFLGDSMLGAAVSNYIWQRFPGSEPGFMTDLRKKIVNNKTLGMICQKIGLDKFYVISKHVEEKCTGRTNLEKLGDVMEAFLAAFWEDCSCDFSVFQLFVRNIIEKNLKVTKLIMQNENYKDLLQKHCQKVFKYTPAYKHVATNGSIFVMAVINPVNNLELARGSATTKQQAEQNACKEALSHMCVL